MPSQGPLYPSAASTTAAGGAFDWGTASSALASDDSYATATNGIAATSFALDLTGFSFSVPASATIDGVTVEIERKGSGAAQPRDHTVQLIKGGTATGDNKAATGTDWPASDAIATYGGAADGWGASLSAANVNASNFGVRVKISTMAAGTASVDSVAVIVHYSAAPGTYILSADYARFYLTGQSAALYRRRMLTADAGSYALVGTAATPRPARKLASASGAFALTSPGASLHYGFTLTADPGAFTLAGTAASLEATRVLIAAAGSYALTGGEAARAASSGTFVLTGTAATLRLARKLAAASGPYAYAGATAALYDTPPKFTGTFDFIYVQSATFDFAYTQSSTVEF